jgi:hypothetical protein
MDKENELSGGITSLFPGRGVTVAPLPWRDFRLGLPPNLFYMAPARRQQQQDGVKAEVTPGQSNIEQPQFAVAPFLK